MSLTKKIFANSLWILLGKIVLSGLGAIITFYFARYLQPEAFGNFSLVIAFVSFFLTFAGSGIEKVVQRDFSKQGKIIPSYLKTSISLRFISAVITTIFCIILSLFFNYSKGAHLAIFLASSTIIIISLNKMVDQIYSFKLEQKIPIIAEVFAKIIYIILSLIVILYFKKGFIWLIVAWIGFYLSKLIITAVFAKGKWKEYKEGKFDKSLARYIIKESWPFLLISSLSIIYIRIDVVLLSLFRSAAEIGFYSAAYRLSETPNLVAAALTTSMFPIFAARIEDRKALGLSIRYLFILSAPLMVGTILISNKIINLIYGSSYLPAAPVLSLLIIATFFVFIKLPSINYLYATGKQKNQMLMVGIGAAFNIIMNLIFIPKYGIIGSAAVTAATEFLVFIIAIYQTKDIIRGLGWIKLFIKTTIVTAIMAAIIIFLNKLEVNVIITIITAIIIYFGLTYIITFDKLDKEIVKKIRNKN